MTAINATILNGLPISTNVNVGQLRIDGNSILGFRFPSTWQAGINITILETEGDNGIYRPLCDLDGDPILITSPAPTIDYPNGKTIKDSSIPAIFYGIKNIKLLASANVTGDQVIQVITDVL